MNLRVKATVLALASLAFLVGGGAAFADEEDDRRPAPGSTELPRPHHPHPEEDELHDRYGEDVGQINLPPLVVKEKPKTGAAGAGLGEPPPSQKLVNAGNANPEANLPVDPSTMNQRRSTPAETFFNAATVGLGAMGLGVVALTSVAIRRSAKLRKDPKADFLYQ